MEHDRPTQKDIARRLGLTQATVSMALDNNPKVADKTRERVLRLAKEMGYTRDPYLSGLSAYRKQTHPAYYQATLAWLVNDRDDSSWKGSPAFQLYYKGAVARAAELGYRIEEHYLRKEGMSSGRMKKLLQARNIVGLILAPQPKANVTIDFEFSPFSAVTFGYTLVHPRLHMVTMHQFRSLKTIWGELKKRNYLRPGLALADESDLRADRNWSAAFISAQQELPPPDRVPVLLGAPFTRETFLAWFEKHRPDVMISMSPEVEVWLKSAGFRVPEEVGVALLSVPDRGKHFSGIWENPEAIGQRAVELVVSLIHSRERGVPDIQLSQLIDGTWMCGGTVRQS